MKLDELYRQIQPRIYAYFFARTLNREAAEDLTHEAFYQAMKSMSSFSGRSSVQTWIFTIARHVLSKYYRSKSYGQSLASKLEQEQNQQKAGSNAAEELVIRKEEQKKLLDAIHQLDELSREIIILRIYGELSFKEIGELTGKSENMPELPFTVQS